MDDWDGEEFRALRAEVDLRITMQNGFLVLLALLFAALSFAQLLMPERRFEIALVFGITAGMFSLFWIHSGARTLQIKTYLTEVLEPRMRTDGGWEKWHARRRIAGVLGSRWFISTKGVLVGSQAAILAEAVLLAAPDATMQWVSAGLAALAAVASAALLRKPKMSSP